MSDAIGVEQVLEDHVTLVPDHLWVVLEMEPVGTETFGFQMLVAMVRIIDGQIPLLEDR